MFVSWTYIQLVWHHNQGTSTMSHSSVHSVTPFNMGTTRCWTPFLGHLEFDFFTLNLWPASIEKEFERELLCLHCPQVIQSYGYFSYVSTLDQVPDRYFPSTNYFTKAWWSQKFGLQIDEIILVYSSFLDYSVIFFLVHCRENIVGFFRFTVYFMLIFKKVGNGIPCRIFLRVPRQAFVDSKPRYTGLSTAATPSKATRHWQKREIVWTSGGMFINMFHCLTDFYSFFAVPDLYE